MTTREEKHWNKMSLTCRVQYLNDVDPFSYSTNFPDPPRPPLHTFSVNLPLINQLAAVHRLLKSPHRVSCIEILNYYVNNFKQFHVWIVRNIIFKFIPEVLELLWFKAIVNPCTWDNAFILLCPLSRAGATPVGFFYNADRVTDSKCETDFFTH